MLDVHEHQFLVLLLVVQSQPNEAGHVIREALAVQQCSDSSVDLEPVGSDFGDTGPCDDAAPWPRVLLSDGLVVAVEQHPVRAVDRFEVGFVPLEYERLEEPGRVCPMPLRRAHIGHRLGGLILAGQR